MNIKILGMGCENCDALYQNCLKAVKLAGVNAEIEKVEDLIEIVKLGVMAAPSMMIDGKLVIAGQVAKAAEIARLIEENR